MSRRASRAPALRRTARARFIVVTGLSGAGKSQAIRALEDLGYFCVDNLPTALIPTLAGLSKRGSGDLPKVAIVVDVRESSFLRDFPKVWARLKATRGLDPVLIFLEASHETLVRRFSESRRPHPLAHGRPVVEGLKLERRRMQKIRALADEVVDTSALTVHQLRDRFLRFSEERGPRQRLLVTLLSFGFKHGLPVDADLVFDVRFLPNPHFVDRLRPKTGHDAPVVRFLERQPVFVAFMERLIGFLEFVVPEYVKEGKSYLTIAIGCTGGRHRSVMIAEALEPVLGAIRGVRTEVRHRDLEVSQ
jgi:UPF0042 nucleotide-binding protein